MHISCVLCIKMCSLYISRISSQGEWWVMCQASISRVKTGDNESCWKCHLFTLFTLKKVIKPFVVRVRAGIEVVESWREKKWECKGFLAAQCSSTEKGILQSMFYLSESQLKKQRAGLHEGGHRRSEEGRRAEWNVDVAVKRERNESGGGGGGGEQMETDREEGQRDSAKLGHHKRTPSHLWRAEWRLTEVDDPRH